MVPRLLMTKDDFSKRCAEADYVWEEFDQHRHSDVYACKNCLTYARRVGASMTTILCAEPGCSSPAEKTATQNVVAFATGI